MKDNNRMVRIIDKSKREKFSRLRKSAEEALETLMPSADVPDPSELSPEEIGDIIHELHVYQVELETQNDELIKLHSDLEAERDKYYELYDLAPVGYFTIDRQGAIQEINLTGASLLGLERSLLKGKPLHCFIARDFQDNFYLKRLQILKTGVRQAFEVKIKKADDTEFYVRLECKPVCDLAGNVNQIRGVIVDIQELKCTEEKLKNSLEEKELLMKEVHHRVRNNLALVSGLLTLQAETEANPVFYSLLQDCKKRIRSVALVHEIMYDSRNLTKIDFSLYIRKLLDQFSHSLNGLEIQPTMEVQIEDIDMPVIKAIPCGIIINELITNAFKHAFTGPTGGEIRIKLGFNDNTSYQLIIGDNGIGLPPDLDAHNTDSFGFKLVDMLIKQLKGTFEIDRKGGTTFKITFPLI